MGYQQLHSEEDETITSSEAKNTNGWKVQFGYHSYLKNALEFKVELLSPSSKGTILGILCLVYIVGLLVGLLLKFLGKNNSMINTGSVISIIMAFLFGKVIALCRGGGTTTKYSATYFYKRYITQHEHISIVNRRAIPIELHEHFSLLMNVYYTKIVTMDGAKNISFQEKERSSRETNIVIGLKVLGTLICISFISLAVFMLRYAIPYVIGDNTGIAITGVFMCFSGGITIVTCIMACWQVWQPSYVVRTPEIELEFWAENRNKIIYCTIKTLAVE